MSQDDGDAKLRNLAGIALRGGTHACELPCLVTGEAKAVHLSEYTIVTHSRGYMILVAVLEAIRSASARANYLLVDRHLVYMCKSDLERWASILDSIYDDPVIRTVLPDLVMISSTTDASMSRIIRGVLSGAFQYDALDLFEHTNSVSEGKFAVCLEMLLGRPEMGAAMVTLRLVYLRLARGGSQLPRDLAESVPLHLHVVEPDVGYDHAPMNSWMRKGATLRLLERFSDNLLHIAAALVEGFGMSKILHCDGSPPLDTLGSATRAEARRVWGILSGRIDPPSDHLSLWLRSWLHGRLPCREESILSAFLMSVVAEWVAELSCERAAHLAGLLPDDFEAMWPFLPEYGDRSDIREALAENLLDGGWQGPGADPRRTRGKSYAKLREGDNDACVASWLDDILERIDWRMDRAVEEMRVA